MTVNELEGVERTIFREWYDLSLADPVINKLYSRLYDKSPGSLKNRLTTVIKMIDYSIDKGLIFNEEQLDVVRFVDVILRN